MFLLFIYTRENTFPKSKIVLTKISQVTGVDFSSSQMNGENHFYSTVSVRYFVLRRWEAI